MKKGFFFKGEIRQRKIGRNIRGKREIGRNGNLGKVVKCKLGRIEI